jgi:hypothetical protein
MDKVEELALGIEGPDLLCKSPTSIISINLILLPLAYYRL